MKKTAPGFAAIEAGGGVSFLRIFDRYVVDVKGTDVGISAQQIDSTCALGCGLGLDGFDRLPARGNLRRSRIGEIKDPFAPTILAVDMCLVRTVPAAFAGVKPG